MRRRTLAAPVLAAMLAGVLAGGFAEPAGAASASAASAARWIVERQTRSGAFFDERQRADALAETIVAVLAGGVSGAPVDSALRALERVAPEDVTRPAYAGRVVAGLVAARKDPRRFGGVDYVARIERGFNAASGSYETGLYSNGLAVLGLVAARVRVPSNVLAYFRANQCADGGFGHDPGCLPRSDADTTSLAVAVFAGLGVPASDPLRARAVERLSAMQSGDGSFAHMAGGEPNANSTALAAMALTTAGERAAAEKARAALREFTDTSGGVRYLRGDRAPNDYATVQAAAAFDLHRLPVLPKIEPARTVVAGTKAPAASPSGSASSSKPSASAGAAAVAGVEAAFGRRGARESSSSAAAPAGAAGSSAAAGKGALSFVAMLLALGVATMTARRHKA